MLLNISIKQITTTPTKNKLKNWTYHFFSPQMSSMSEKMLAPPVQHSDSVSSPLQIFPLKMTC